MPVGDFEGRSMELASPLQGFKLIFSLNWNVLRSILTLSSGLTGSTVHRGVREVYHLLFKIGGDQFIRNESRAGRNTGPGGL